jgi:hypothetical protein
MSRSYTSSLPSAYMACNGTASLTKVIKSFLERTNPPTFLVIFNNMLDILKVSDLEQKY